MAKIKPNSNYAKAIKLTTSPVLAQANNNNDNNNKKIISHRKANAHTFTQSALCFVPQIHKSISPRHGQISKKLFRWSRKITWCHLQHAGGDGTSAAAFSSHAETAQEAHMNDNVAAVGAPDLLGTGSAGLASLIHAAVLFTPFFYYQCIFIAGGIGKM